ncbi:MAG: DUF2004 domain-containing protein [Flavobacteriaceae bacterium]|jgi:hypothetical protein|nr:DUF2004 domain-containing protein [Flavobacteriaceae bacterium]
MTIIKKLYSYLSSSKGSVKQITSTELPYFGEINYAQLDEHYSTEIEFDSFRLNLYLGFKSKNIHREEIESVKEFLEHISVFDIQNRIEINNDLNNEGEAKEYVDFYIDELEEEELSEIIDYHNLNESKEQQLINKLRLVSIGLYSDDNQHDGVFEYSIEIDEVMSNQVLVIYTDINGNINHISWES